MDMWLLGMKLDLGENAHHHIVELVCSDKLTCSNYIDRKLECILAVYTL